MSTVLENSNNKNIITSEAVADKPSLYDWRYIWGVAKEHKKEIILANFIAIIATLASVPITTVNATTG